MTQTMKLNDRKNYIVVHISEMKQDDKIFHLAITGRSY